MIFHTRMPPLLKGFFQAELNAFREVFGAGRLTQAWSHLERAHVIGQAYPIQHSLVHWKMLRFGIRIKSPKEVLGQMPRLLVGGVKSFVGKIPVGNTGGADVPPLRPMPIPEDIRAMFRQVNHS